MRGHIRQDIFRFLRGDLSGPERVRVENHLKECAECCDFLEFVLDFNATLKEMAATDLQPDTPCPDPEMLAAFEAEELDEKAAQLIRQHTVFCKDCLEELYLLRQAAQRSAEESRRQESSSKEAPLPLRQLELGGETSGFVVFPDQLVKMSKGYCEISAGENTYRVEVTLAPEGAVFCDIKGIQISVRVPLSVHVVLYGDSGKTRELTSTTTDTSGNRHFLLWGKPTLRPLKLGFFFYMEDGRMDAVRRIPPEVIASLEESTAEKTSHQNRRTKKDK